MDQLPEESHLPEKVLSQRVSAGPLPLLLRTTRRPPLSVGARVPLPHEFGASTEDAPLRTRDVGSLGHLDMAKRAKEVLDPVLAMPPQLFEQAPWPPLASLTARLLGKRQPTRSLLAHLELTTPIRYPTTGPFRPLQRVEPLAHAGETLTGLLPVSR